MALQIFNNGSSIRLVTGEGEALLMKHSISHISIIRGDMVIIRQKNGKIISFSSREASAPGMGDDVQVSSFINQWINDSVCCNCSPSVSY